MVIPPNASTEQRKALNEYRHFMIRELIQDQRDFEGHIKFFGQRGMDALEAEIVIIKKTRRQYE